MDVGLQIDNVNGQVLDRGTRRVSFTFRKVSVFIWFLNRIFLLNF
jgi:hypothetical protein